MSDSINEQRCERNGLPISGCAASEYDCARFGVCAASPSVVTPPRQVRGFALCAEPSGVPGRACEMYEGHDGPHRLMPGSFATPPAQFVGNRADGRTHGLWEIVHMTAEKMGRAHLGELTPGARSRRLADAAFIAAASPDVILALVAELVGLRTEVDQLRGENAELTRERDLAIAHDTQPYPTAWAYEQACRVMHEAKAERDALQAEVERLHADVERQTKRADAVELIEGRARGLAQERAAALQARIDAAQAVVGGWVNNTFDHTFDLCRLQLATALGVDPQKETQQ